MDLSKYTLENYMRIVTYKTAFYSFYLPVACGLLITGVQDAKTFDVSRDILIQMGQYFQVQSLAFLLAAACMCLKHRPSTPDICGGCSRHKTAVQRCDASGSLCRFRTITWTALAHQK